MAAVVGFRCRLRSSVAGWLTPWPALLLLFCQCRFRAGRGRGRGGDQGGVPPRRPFAAAAALLLRFLRLLPSCRRSIGFSVLAPAAVATLGPTFAAASASAIDAADAAAASAASADPPSPVSKVAPAAAAETAPAVAAAAEDSDDGEEGAAAAEAEAEAVGAAAVDAMIYAR